MVEEPPGENCPAGGIKVTVIRNGKHVSDYGEDRATEDFYVCNGEDGEDGEDGDDGAPVRPVLPARLVPLARLALAYPVRPVLPEPMARPA